MSLLPTCRDMSRRLSEARDLGRRLGLLERLHLGICDVCRRFRAHLAAMGVAVASEPGTGPELTGEAKERMKRALRG